jgi:recombination protein RecA
MQSGAWFAYKDKNIAQGREQVLRFLKENSDIADEITAQVHEVIRKKKLLGK